MGNSDIANDLSYYEIEHWGPETVGSLGRLASALETYSDVVAESQATGEIARAESELVSAQAVLQDRRVSFQQVSLRVSRLKQLSGAAAKALVDVTTARFAAIEPLVTDIYSRLDPHPAFKIIGFKHDLYYRKGTSTPVVSDIVAGVDADPLIVFSASQANIAALSYFLAMSLGAGERALPFVLLDDPLQSMDDVNVLGFADLCRFLRADRQLVLSTHDRRFANLLRRKLAPRDPRDRTIAINSQGGIVAARLWKRNCSHTTPAMRNCGSYRNLPDWAIRCYTRGSMQYGRHRSGSSRARSPFAFCRIPAW